MDLERTQLVRIGKYPILGELGEGGMGVVYKAQDPDLRREVAVKILKEEQAADPVAKARFEEEAVIGAGLRHDNIVQVHDFGAHAGRPYMVMELLEGEDLSQAIAGNRTGTLRNKLIIAWQTAKALEYIHQNDLVHRDIKPHNIHIDRDGRARLLDFGITKRPDLALSRDGEKPGSPLYMSPEQSRGEEVTRSSDIWSFGVMLYELLTGNRPFGGDSLSEVCGQIRHEAVDLEPLRTSGATKSVQELIRRCLSKDSRDRPRTATEIREKLQEILDEVDLDEGGGVLRKWLVRAAIGVLIVAAIWFVKEMLQPRRPAIDRARTFYNTGRGESDELPLKPGVSVAARHLGLRYQVLVRDPVARAFVAVDPGRTFRTTDCLQILLESNRSGYLYLLDLQSNGAWKAIPPRPGQAKTIHPGSSIRVPPNGCMFFYPPGIDKLFILFSRNPDEWYDMYEGIVRAQAAQSQTANDDLQSFTQEIERHAGSSEILTAQVTQPRATEETEHSVYVVRQSDSPSSEVVAQINIWHPD